MRGLVGLGWVGLDLGGGVRALASRFEPRMSCSSVSSSDARAAATSCVELCAGLAAWMLPVKRCASEMLRWLAAGPAALGLQV